MNSGRSCGVGTKRAATTGNVLARRNRGSIHVDARNISSFVDCKRNETDTSSGGQGRVQGGLSSPSPSSRKRNKWSFALSLGLQERKARHAGSGTIVALKSTRLIRGLSGYPPSRPPKNTTVHFQVDEEPRRVHRTPPLRLPGMCRRYSHVNFGPSLPRINTSPRLNGALSMIYLFLPAQ